MTNPYWPLPTPDSLGEIIGADDVRDNVKATIDTWAPFYLSALSARLATAGRIGGKGQPNNPLPSFGTWTNQPAHRSWGTGQPAAYLVTVPATSGTPDLQGNRKYIAIWRVQVNIQVFGTTWQEAADLVSWYEKVVRWCVLQHRSLGGFAMSTKWAGVQYSATVHDSSRTLGQAVIGFDVQVGDVIDLGRGPSTVPTGIPPQDPTVETVIVDLTRVPVTDEV